MPLILILFAFLLLAYVLKSRLDYGKGFSKDIPGPSFWLKLPLVGHGYMIRQKPLESMKKLKEKYGPIFRMDLGVRRTIVVCDHEIYVEAEKSGALSKRPASMTQGLKLGKQSGVASSHGHVWREQRRFLVSSLSQLGFAKKDVSGIIISDEIENLVNRLQKMAERNEPLHSTYFFLNTANRIIWKLAFGTTLSDNQFERLKQIMIALVKNFGKPNITVILQQRSLIFAQFLKYIASDSSMLTKEDFLRSNLENTVRDQEPNAEGYLAERVLAKINSSKDDLQSSFHGLKGQENLRALLRDLFIAGTDTNGVLMEWITLYLCVFPKFQEELFKEIVQVFGMDGTISIQDADKLPLINAFILEVARHSPFLGFALPRASDSDMIINGFSVPKDTQILFIPFMANHDPKMFSNPDDFNPKRFLNDDGMFIYDDRVHFFGRGMRRCPGERLGKNLLFLFTAKMVQKFKLSNINEASDLSYEWGLVVHPKTFQAKIQLRIQSK